MTYTSSNYFMAIAAEHMNAKVSPYLALLTELKSKIPAMSRLGSVRAPIGSGSTTFLDSNGNILKRKELDK